MSSPLIKVLRIARNLNKEQAEILFQQVLESIDEQDSLIEWIEARNQTIEEHGVHCPECGSTHLYGNGNYNGVKRHKCKDCGKSFNDLTGTCIHYLHKKDRFIEFLELMFSTDLSIRGIAKEMGIHKDTIFQWRHKVLFAFESQLDDKMEGGLVEADETLFPFSEKGQRQFNRPARLRGGVHTRGINDKQVSVVVMSDRDGNFDLDVVRRSRIKVKDLDVIIKPRLKDDSVLCTDSNSVYKGFTRKHDIEHYRILAYKKKYVEGKYHLQHINNIMSECKKSMKRFNGIATKYLQNYLNWYKAGRLLRKIEDKIGWLVEVLMKDSSSRFHWKYRNGLYSYFLVK